jgi:putative endonuclease
MTHCVYIVECNDDAGSLYTGYTTDVARRIRQHNSGNGAKYTRGRTPVTIRYVEYYTSRSAAQSREYEIKSLSRTAKEELINSPDQQIPISVHHD